jgi:hypothetical protein
LPDVGFISKYNLETEKKYTTALENLQRHVNTPTSRMRKRMKTSQKHRIMEGGSIRRKRLITR